MSVQLSVSGLSVDAFDESLARHTRLVSDVGFSISSGQVLGITGESGSGKTTLGLAIAGMLPPEMSASVAQFHFRATASANWVRPCGPRNPAELSPRRSPWPK